MSKKIHIMYSKIEKDENGYAKKIRDCSYTEEELQNIYSGDYKKMFPLWGDLPEYDSETHCIYYGIALSYPGYNSETNSIEEMSEYNRYLAGGRALQDGEYVDADTESIVTVENPSIYHTWNPETNEYEFTKVDEKRSDLVSEATDIKNELEDNTIIEYGGFDTLSESISSITSSVSRYSTYGRTTTWYNLDKAGILITDENLQDLISLGLITSDHIQRCFDTRSFIKKEVESASEVELENYDLKSRWEEVSAAIVY